MSKNFKGPRASSSNAQPGEQDQYNPTSDIYLSNGASQFKGPFTPRPAVQPGEQIEQGQYHSTPGPSPSSRATQFRIPTTPIPHALSIPSVGVPAIPIRP